MSKVKNPEKSVCHSLLIFVVSGRSGQFKHIPTGRTYVDMAVSCNNCIMCIWHYWASPQTSSGKHNIAQPTPPLGGQQKMPVPVGPLQLPP